ncbi:hypothetical protein GCM10010346_31420 [Streptomyces chryseus]|uniref:Uncharacterized protein n=1 Tax=Streptomyces chryseus TaxID=68186 RepID=A0ABQ3DNP5_9ACTN|nr:hypothetical protein GCM10010346_31420 [Streptomyces chryseus]
MPLRRDRLRRDLPNPGQVIIPTWRSRPTGRCDRVPGAVPQYRRRPLALVTPGAAGAGRTLSPGER